MRQKLLTLMVFFIVALVKCGDKSSSDPTPTASLSTSYATQCSSCHGSDGATAPVGTTKVIKATVLSQTDYTAIVRQGRKSTAMAAFGTSIYSSDNLVADYNILKK